jgi:hypothetical protein
MLLRCDTACFFCAGIRMLLPSQDHHTFIFLPHSQETGSVSPIKWRSYSFSTSPLIISAYYLFCWYQPKIPSVPATKNISCQFRTAFGVVKPFLRSANSVKFPSLKPIQLNTEPDNHIGAVRGWRHTLVRGEAMRAHRHSFYIRFKNVRTD